MKEPKYECDVCGTTLPRDEQGVFLWCQRCRALWELGFTSGVSLHSRVMECGDADAINRIMNDAAPYLV